MITLTKKEIRTAIEKYIPTNEEMVHTTAVKTWLLENVFDYDIWIRDDYCGMVVRRMAKEGFFETFRTQTNTMVYVRR